MKRIFRLAAISIFLCQPFFSPGQAIDPAKSAKATAASDAEFIATNIRDNEDAIFLSQQAVERGTDARMKEFAQQMVEDHSMLLYSLQELETAGKGASKDGPEQHRPAAAAVNEKLSNLRGTSFDSVWVANLLLLQQAKADELTQAKETVTNPQLKAAVTQALPVVRKHVSELKSIQKYLLRLAIQRRKEAEAAAKAR